MRTSLIEAQRCKTSLSATEPRGLTQSEVTHKLFKRLFVATVAATMFGTSAHAAQCQGPIAAVAMHDDGRIFVRQGTLNSPIWSICNVNNSQGYVASVTTCKSWLAILMAAQKAGATVQLYTNSTPCNLGDWGNADVFFLEDRG